MKFTDQMGQTIELKSPAKRIVSLVPSQTEFLYQLGLEEEVVGITKFCIHPDSWFRSKKRVGGTKNVKRERVLSLQPDLIIGNKEENDQENIESLKDVAPVWMSDIFTLDDSFQMMLEIGRLTDREEKAKEIVAKIKSEFQDLKKITGLKVLYFIWKKPWMLAGTDTFIHEMLSVCGFENVVNENRYPVLELDEFPKCDCIFLSSEPYPFKKEDIDELQNHFPKTKILLVDGEMFSWYGSRLLEAPKYFEKLINSVE